MDGSGNLAITTNKLMNNKKYFCQCGYCKCSSGRILTRGKTALKYEKIEARIKMPKGSGT
jgi:beta-glucanase (GH16 family)